MSDFENRLQAMCAAEASAGAKDADRMGAMVENIARALGFTIAMAARGDPKVIDEMMHGADAYAHAEAVDKAPFARFMSAVKGPRP